MRAPFPIAAALGMIAGAAQAAELPCLPRAQLHAALAARYDEIPVAAGPTNAGGLVEVLATQDGGTWTIIVTGADGVACAVAAGEGWRQDTTAPAERGS